MLLFLYFSVVFTLIPSLFPPPLLSLFLCRVLSFPRLHVLCTSSVSGDTHCASYSGYLRVTKKEKSTQSKHCTSRVFAELKKRRLEGDILTAWREKVETNCDTTNTQCVSLAHFALSRVPNVILKGMRDWDGYLISYHLLQTGCYNHNIKFSLQLN